MGYMSSKPDYTYSNGYVLIGDLGKESGGHLDVFCCAREISIDITAEEEEVICDPTDGPVDRIDHSPRATVTLQELNFNETVLERALRLTASYNTVGYRTVGKGTNPNTVPTDMNEVDGPYAPTYNGNNAVVALANGFIIPDANQIAMWTYDDSTDTFVTSAGFTVSLGTSDPAIGVIAYSDVATPAIVYFTYNYSPMTPGSVELKNPWNTGADEAFMRIVHEHGNGTDLVIVDIWRVRPKANQSLQIKTLSGDRVLPVDFEFDVFADRRNHPDSPIMAITFDTIGRTITPEYGCEGATWATPVAGG
jgi:hypothetical protein